MTTATSTRVSIRRETLDTFLAEAMPLLEKHYHEISHYPDIPLDIDVGRYRSIENGGGLRVFTARGEDERLTGYAVFIVAMNPHYRSSRQAMQDVLYVDPDYRRGRLGIRLIRDAETMLLGENVQVIYHHVKRAHPALGTILERIGYERVETIYAKRLDR